MDKTCSSPFPLSVLFLIINDIKMSNCIIIVKTIEERSQQVKFATKAGLVTDSNDDKLWPDALSIHCLYPIHHSSEKLVGNGEERSQKNNYHFSNYICFKGILFTTARR